MHFPNQELPPIEDLLAIAEITEETVENAIALWEDNPPVREFANILNATEV